MEAAGPEPGMDAPGDVGPEVPLDVGRRDERPTGLAATLRHRRFGGRRSRTRVRTRGPTSARMWVPTSRATVSTTPPPTPRTARTSGVDRIARWRHLAAAGYLDECRLRRLHHDVPCRIKSAASDYDPDAGQLTSEACTPSLLMHAGATTRVTARYTSSLARAVNQGDCPTGDEKLRKWREQPGFLLRCVAAGSCTPRSSTSGQTQFCHNSCECGALTWQGQVAAPSRVPRRSGFAAGSAPKRPGFLVRSGTIREGQ